MPGGYGFQVLVHELGHGLGLAHPHDDGGASEVMQGVVTPFDSYGQFDLNQGVFYGDCPTTTVGRRGTATLIRPNGLGGGRRTNGLRHRRGASSLRREVQSRRQRQLRFAQPERIGDQLHRPVGHRGDRYDRQQRRRWCHDRSSRSDTAEPAWRRRLCLPRRQWWSAASPSPRAHHIENATGGPGRDNFTGNALANVFIGNGSDDSITGGGGRDFSVYSTTAAAATLRHNFDNSWDHRGRRRRRGLGPRGGVRPLHRSGYQSDRAVAVEQRFQCRRRL